MVSFFFLGGDGTEAWRTQLSAACEKLRPWPHQQVPLSAVTGVLVGPYTLESADLVQVGREGHTGKGLSWEGTALRGCVQLR